MVAPAAGNRFKLANGKDRQPWGYLKVTHTVQSRNLRVNRNLMNARKPWTNAGTRIVRMSSFRCFELRQDSKAKSEKCSRSLEIPITESPNYIESSSLDNKNSLVATFFNVMRVVTIHFAANYSSIAHLFA